MKTVATPVSVRVPGVIHLVTVNLLHVLAIHGQVCGQVFPILEVRLVMLHHLAVLHTALGLP